MNSKSLKTLEYNKIIEQLAEHAASSLGKERCLNLLPSDNLNEILVIQQETSDALTRIYKNGSISLSGIKDIHQSFMSLEVGSTLSASELLSIASILTTSAKAKAYSRTKDTSENEVMAEDTLDARFNALEPLTPLNNEITRCILAEDIISDDASPTLKTIRRSIKITNNKIHEHLNTFINSQDAKNKLQDNLITMRNGRYCIPVKSEYKSHIDGMIHDQSSSGSTFFIEPAAVVKYNNELSELAAKESDEIYKILSSLSNLAAEHVATLKNNLELLTDLDFIFAKAQLAKNMKATMPVFNSDKIIDIKRGRHPLINPKQVVPIDINLGINFNQLIITGPNTGGKTVSLKTVGLLTLMGQAGLHIPAFDGSILTVFKEVYADIGDEQSIEQNLSTFSSHMTNTISILNSADEDSLVLFDELGAGTDPTEGAALAMAILSHLHNCNITTMATTHYSEIKIYALETNGAENACCEFDVATLRPTYRLLIGIPGKSNAFAISKKLGLPDFLIENAKTNLSSSDKKFEDTIAELEASRIAIEQEREELKNYKENVDKLMRDYTEKSHKLEKNREKLLNNAREEANNILQEAKDYADSTIRKYNKLSSSSGNIKDMEKERNELNKKLKNSEFKKSPKQTKSNKKHSIKDFKLGDSVMIVSLGYKGTVTSLPNAKGDLTVQTGIFNSRVNISDLELLDEEVITGPNIKKTGSGKIKMSKSFNISPEINVIGKTVDEALSLVDKYLDDAYLAHLPQVTIIHGRGTGALRNAIGTHLKRTKYIKSFRAGSFGEGDQGVTIVEFK